MYTAIERIVEYAAADHEPPAGYRAGPRVMPDAYELRPVEIALAEIASEYLDVTVLMIIACVALDRRTVGRGNRTRSRRLKLDRFSGENGVSRGIIVSCEHDIFKCNARAAVDLEGVIVGNVLDDDIFKGDVFAADDGGKFHLCLAEENSAADAEV